MRTPAAIATLGVILSVLGFGSGAQARVRKAHAPPRPLVVYFQPYPFGDRYAYYSLPGPYQLASPYHTLCGFSLVTNCRQESSYGP